MFYKINSMHYNDKLMLLVKKTNILNYIHVTVNFNLSHRIVNFIMQFEKHLYLLMTI